MHNCSRGDVSKNIDLINSGIIVLEDNCQIKLGDNLYGTKMDTLFYFIKKVI